MQFENYEKRVSKICRETQRKLPHSSNLDFDDLFSEAQIVFLKAVDKHVKEKGEFYRFFFFLLHRRFLDILKKEYNQVEIFENHIYLSECDKFNNRTNTPHIQIPADTISTEFLHHISAISKSIFLSENAREFLNLVLEPTIELMELFGRKNNYSPSMITGRYLKKTKGISIKEILRIRNEIRNVFRES